MADRVAASQRGWAGALLMLFALLITMALAAVALRQYGVAPGGAPRAVAAEAPGAAPEGETAGRQPALERARELQETVRRQAEEMRKRIDSADQ